MINPRSIATLGKQFGALARATLGRLYPEPIVITQYWGGAGNYREYKRKKPPIRVVKKLVKEVAREIIPEYRPIPAFTKELDMDRVIALIQYEGRKTAAQFIRNAIERQVRKEQEDDDMLILMML
jgi:hypothetical protein